MAKKMIPALPDFYTTLEVARLLGIGVQKVQTMFEQGELVGWKTPRGHRRINRKAFEAWASVNRPDLANRLALNRQHDVQLAGHVNVLLVEDSAYVQRNMLLFINQRFDGCAVRVACEQSKKADDSTPAPDIIVVGTPQLGLNLQSLIKARPKISRTKIQSIPLYQAQKDFVLLSNAAYIEKAIRMLLTLRHLKKRLSVA